MQPKVSIVITCYNKADYIGEMLDSVIAQEWNAIEIILVNDGSTDGTRNVISGYEPKMQERGFDIIIIDQENRGVCAAARAGLERITGDLVCVVDADDELDSKYVSSMAGWLYENKDYDYCTCGCRYITGLGKEKEYGSIWIPAVNRRRPLTEDYLLVNIRWAIWAYIVRVEYLKKCRITETYITDMRGSQEPSFMIPLTAYNGKSKVFQEALYNRRLNVEGALSYHNTFDKTAQHMDEYLLITRKAIDLLPCEVADDERKQVLLHIAEYAVMCRKFDCAKSLNETQHTESIFRQILAFANNYFSVSPEITRQQTQGLERTFIQEVSKALIKGRIIGYGVLGRAAAKSLPLLKGTPLEPTELWDINGDGIKVKKPDFDGLDIQDTVIVFPKGQIEKELRCKLQGAPSRVLYQDDIRNYLVEVLFSRRLRNENLTSF